MTLILFLFNPVFSGGISPEKTGCAIELPVVSGEHPSGRKRVKSHDIKLVA